MTVEEIGVGMTVMGICVGDSYGDRCGVTVLELGVG